MAAKGWKLVTGTANIYAYESAVSGGEDIPVFDYIKILDDAIVSDYDGKTIKVTGYAIQKDGFDTAEAAWAQAPSSWK